MKIWVYAEEERGEIRKTTLELLGRATDLAADSPEPTEVGAVLLTPRFGSQKEPLEAAGAEKIWLCEDDELAEYHPAVYAAILADWMERENPDIVLFGATSIGSELAPTVAAIVRTGLAAHCADLRLNREGLLVADVPAFGGKIIGEILIPAARPQMASVKPGVFPVKERIQNPQAAEILRSEKKISWRELRGFKPKGTFVSETRGKPIEEAELVIAGGYGLGGPENWGKLQTLAELLGGAVAATRPCVDEGWADSEEIMIGTSGKTVRPKIYLGFGISGATHHICGMKDSNLVLSVNRDEEAEIFRVSDFYAVADAGEVLSALIAEARRVRDASEAPGDPIG